ncbi:MAG: VOC family protein [Candidatus Dormibacteraeota bacterium]|nr:VOC family protein [Candidatus Dormibacteraeota bacterium]
MDMKLELVPVPVSDVDRAKSFYVDQVGFTADGDFNIGGGVRFVQLTPPGSACSIAIGTGITPSAPGSAQGLLLVVSDVEAARTALAQRGVQVTEARDEPWGARHAYFNDPDGNSWQLQQPRGRSGQAPGAQLT